MVRVERDVMRKSVHHTDREREGNRNLGSDLHRAGHGSATHFEQVSIGTVKIDAPVSAQWIGCLSV